MDLHVCEIVICFFMSIFFNLLLFSIHIFIRCDLYVGLFHPEVIRVMHCIFSYYCDYAFFDCNFGSCSRYLHFNISCLYYRHHGFDPDFLDIIIVFHKIIQFYVKDCQRIKSRLCNSYNFQNIFTVIGVFLSVFIMIFMWC